VGVGLSIGKKIVVCIVFALLSAGLSIVWYDTGTYISYSAGESIPFKSFELKVPAGYTGNKIVPSNFPLLQACVQTIFNEYSDPILTESGTIRNKRHQYFMIAGYSPRWMQRESKLEGETNSDIVQYKDIIVPRGFGKHVAFAYKSSKDKSLVIEKLYGSGDVEVYINIVSEKSPRSPKELNEFFLQTYRQK